MRLLIPALALLNLCGTSGGATGDAPTTVHRGPGWAMHLPAEGARVTVEPDRIAVDVSDYSRWFDVRWVPATPDLSVHARNLAATTCDPVVFDRPIVEEDSLTAGGLCTRGNRFQWLITRVERRGERNLLFFYVANPDFVSFEDAWVDFARTAATITSGEDPLPPPDGPPLRARIRAAAANAGASDSPLPGGGVLSTLVIPDLQAIWTARARSASPPWPLDGSAAQ